jgi:long-chain acyl-CoA synthetase
VTTLIQRFAENASKFPQKVALIWEEGQISYEEFYSQVARLAGGLRSSGLEPGQTVLICTGKSHTLALYYLAVWMAGGIAVPVNWKLSPPRLAHLGEIIKPSVILFADEYWDAAITTAAKLTTSPKLVGENRGIRWSELVSIGYPPSDLPDPQSVVYLNFTSGSTGEPKGARTTLANLDANCRAATEGLHLTPDDVQMSMFAAYSHPHELFARAIHLGGTVVLQESIYPRSLAEAVAKYRITALMAIPVVYAQLMRFAQVHDLGSLRLAEAGGMVTPVSLSQEFNRMVGIPITTVWGSTETTGIALSNYGHEKELCGSLGFALPGYRVHLADESGGEIMDGDTSGELVISGDGVVSGYWNPGQDEGVFVGGHYYSGDIVQKGIAGEVNYMGRSDGVLKVAGEKVQPAEIEKLLLELDEVEEVAVAATPDPVRGEVPVAFVVPSPGAKLSADVLRKHLAERLPAIKVPRLYMFLPALPRTASGKVDLKALQGEPANFPQAMLNGITERISRLNVSVLDILSDLSKLFDEEQTLRQKENLGPVSHREDLARLRELQGFNRGELHDEALERIFTYLWETLRLTQEL